MCMAPVCCRFVRFVRLLRIIPGFALTIEAFGDIVPVLSHYACILAGTFYAFAILGMLCFHGVLSQEAALQSSYGESHFEAINYDTLAGALTCDVYLLVNNDWPVVMEGVVAVLGRAGRLYFFGFWLIHTVLVLNVVVAFVIDSFSTQKAKREALNACQDKGGRISFGLEDWAKLVMDSGIDFSQYRLTRRTHHADVYDELYKEEVWDKHVKVFAQTRTAIALPSLPSPS